MPDLFQQFVNSPVGRQVAQQVGLPAPADLRRYEPGDPVVHGPVLVGGAPGGRLLDPTLKVLHGFGAEVKTDAFTGSDTEPDERFAALVFDASGVTDSSALRAVYDFFHPAVRHLRSSGRLLVLGSPPADAGDAREVAAQQALEGFMRSAGKEMRKGSTAQLVRVAEGAEDAVESTLRFLLSGRSAYVSGQVIRLDPPVRDGIVRPDDWDRPLAGKVALVTGAARGIGESIAEVLSRDGAHVVCLDLPSAGEQLSAVANRVGGSTVQLDITSEDAPRYLADHLTERHGGIDVFVHNAGVTRDKTIVGMSQEAWDFVLDVNLSAQERINDVLIGDGVLNEGGRIVSLSSTSGIAGNRGQTNYAASKAGIIGMVRALAADVRELGATANAIAPGFIETEMTAEMPVVPRTFGRLVNSLNQGGLPVDVAETVAWLANPASDAVNGQTVRVCGQSMLGA